MVDTVSGVLILHAVPPVGVGDKLEPDSAIILPLSTVEKTANGLAQQMRQDLATLSIVQLMEITVNGQSSRLAV